MLDPGESTIARSGFTTHPTDRRQLLDAALPDRLLPAELEFQLLGFRDLRPPIDPQKGELQHRTYCRREHAACLDGRQGSPVMVFIDAKAFQNRAKSLLARGILAPALTHQPFDMPICMLQASRSTCSSVSSIGIERLSSAKRVTAILDV